LSRTDPTERVGHDELDRVARFPTLEEGIDDLRAVLDAVGSKRTALFGSSEGGPMSPSRLASWIQPSANIQSLMALTKNGRSIEDGPELVVPGGRLPLRFVRSLSPGSGLEPGAIASQI
jgi:hypothetical protein